MEKHTPGVYVDRKKDNSIYYRASLTFRRKHISLGGFAKEEQAHDAYLEARRLLFDEEITLLSYEETSPLSFDKWVSLLNFRDNGMYLVNPIYILRKMFYYYLTPDDILKFDADDLFYYSSHKIMRRGSHLFVADYGMQVNIHSRYGIRSHAVVGRDYRFLNGDTMDYRSTNLEIINRYYGVTKVLKSGTIMYRAVIHVKGNFVIGTYEHEAEAAIAYNKAVDLLKKNGYSKKYAINYIDCISEDDYGKCYQKVKISKKLHALTSPNSQ